MKNIKFISVMFLLLFARGCDFYSTSLWIFQENGLEGEMNPLTQHFGVGWNGLVLANVAVLLLVGFCYYIYVFKYKMNNNLELKPKKALEYVSILYYGSKNKLWKLFYKVPKNRTVAIAHTGYIATWSIIIASFLAMAHTMLIFYGNYYYNSFMESIEYSMVVFYGIAFSPLIYFSIRLYKIEFKEYQKLKSVN